MAVHVKGLVLRARKEYIEKQFGAETFERIIEAASPEARAVLREEIMISSWYPLLALIEMAAGLDRLHGHGDMATSRAMGRTAALTALQGVHQSFAREHDPGFVIRMSPLLWGQYYDSGRAEAESAGPESALVRILDFQDPHRAICLGVIGWGEAAIEVWGGVDARIEERKCRVWGDDCCEFVWSWRDETTRAAP